MSFAPYNTAMLDAHFSPVAELLAHITQIFLCTLHILLSTEMEYFSMYFYNFYNVGACVERMCYKSEELAETDPTLI